MKLKLSERAIVTTLLPETGGIDTARILLKLRNDLGFTEEENEHHKVRPTGDGRIQWDDDTGSATEIEVGKVAQAIVVDALQKLHQEEELRAEHVPLWDLFVEDGDNVIDFPKK